MPSNLWVGNDDVDDTHIAAYHEFLHSDDAHSYLPLVAEEINHAEQYLQDKEPATNDPESANDEWMLLCQTNQRFDSNHQLLEHTNTLSTCRHCA